jgi:hypothetical protein
MAESIFTQLHTRPKPRNMERFLHVLSSTSQAGGFRDARIPVSSNSLYTFLRLLGSGFFFFDKKTRTLLNKEAK